MSDEFENNFHQANDQDIIDVDAREQDAEQSAKEQSTYSYENYSNPSSSEYSGPDYASGSASSNASDSTNSQATGSSFSNEGNGTYRYSGTSDHEYYHASPESGGGSGRGPSGHGGGRKKGPVILAAVLVVTFLACACAGVWGVKTYLGNTTAAVASSSEAIESKDGEENKENEADVKSSESTETQDSEKTESAESTETNNGEVTTEVVASSGLILSDAEAPATEISKTVEKVMPSVVSVYNNYTQKTQYFGQTYTSAAESTGSGIIVGKTDTELLIVSNNHVVEGADSLKVQFIDGTNASADIKGTDSSADLAVIAVQLTDVSADTQKSISVATLNASGKTKVGEDVIAIGNALGYGQSVTTGIVSAVDREIAQEDGITGTFIQTDAAINPGNSGGALLNANGEVIGINSSKIGGSSVEGMGFAIPISKALPIIEELMSQDTKVKVAEDEQGTLGISGVSVTSDVASAYGMPQGVYVAQILDGGGAATSELQKGDIITSIGGVSISSMEMLQKQLQYYAAGTTVTLNVQRQDGSGAYADVQVEVTLGTKASLQQASEKQNEQTQQNGSQEQQGAQSPDSESDSERGNSGYGSMFPFGF